MSLLFLVCAVISSVLVVAATTVGGRMSSLREMDQRYYAVTDAASVLCDTFNEQSVIVAYDKDDPLDPGKMQVKSSIATVTEVDPILTDASKKVVLYTLARDSKTSLMPDWLVNSMSEQEITMSGTGSNAVKCKCAMTETVLENGLLVFDIAASAADAKAASSGAYTLSVTFTPKVKKTALDTSQGEATATVSWKLSDIRKVRPMPSVSPSESP